MTAPTLRASFDGDGGDRIEAELWLPEGEARGGVLLVHEALGIDSFTHRVARTLVGAGWATLVPDLWSRETRAEGSDGEAPWSAERARAAAAALSDRRVAGDLESAAAYLAERCDVAGRLGVLGSSTGGTQAFLFACRSRRVEAAVLLYAPLVYGELSASKPVQPLEMALNLSAPLLAVFGGRDDWAPPEHARRLRDTLGSFAKPFEELTVPGAGHGFLDPRRPVHEEEEAGRVWSRVLQFLDRALAPDAA